MSTVAGCTMSDSRQRQQCQLQISFLFEFLSFQELPALTEELSFTFRTNSIRPGVLQITVTCYGSKY